MPSVLYRFWTTVRQPSAEVTCVKLLNRSRSSLDLDERAHFTNSLFLWDVPKNQTELVRPNMTMVPQAVCPSAQNILLVNFVGIHFCCLLWYVGMDPLPRTAYLTRGKSNWSQIFSTFQSLNRLQVCRRTKPTACFNVILLHIHRGPINNGEVP